MRSIFKSFIAGAIAMGLFSVPSMAASDMDSWKKAVVKTVVKKQKYPRAALAREIEGTAKVRLTVSADGTIMTHEVVEATGETVLDNEIPKLMKRLNPLPSLPAGQDEVSLVLPLDWKLN
ncbi:MAG: TonB family protein [Kordiimonadaceae bacterium]|nr:TonB family protein [Kordiimonadaceae bacterium]MBO6568567.1 TonB family protein [Kordiimonadaceae bacterium]MBO6963704.1 TonB family protein [Kordiimonadaceae bacterium]